MSVPFGRDTPYPGARLHGQALREGPPLFSCESQPRAGRRAGQVGGGAGPPSAQQAAGLTRLSRRHWDLRASEETKHVVSHLMGRRVYRDANTREDRP